MHSESGLRCQVKCKACVRPAAEPDGNSAKIMIGNEKNNHLRNFALISKLIFINSLTP